MSQSDNALLRRLVEATNASEDAALKELVRQVCQSLNPATTGTALRRHVEQQAADEVCSICLDPFSLEDHALARLTCAHVFHLSCIGNTFNFQGEMKCPNCRQPQDNKPGQWMLGSDEEDDDNDDDDNDDEEEDDDGGEEYDYDDDGDGEFDDDNAYPFDENGEGDEYDDPWPVESLFTHEDDGEVDYVGLEEDPVDIDQVRALAEILRNVPIHLINSGESTATAAGTAALECDNDVDDGRDYLTPNLFSHDGEEEGKEEEEDYGDLPNQFNTSSMSEDGDITDGCDDDDNWRKEQDEEDDVQDIDDHLRFRPVAPRSGHPMFIPMYPSFISSPHPPFGVPLGYPSLYPSLPYMYSSHVPAPAMRVAQHAFPHERGEHYRIKTPAVAMRAPGRPLRIEHPDDPSIDPMATPEANPNSWDEPRQPSSFSSSASSSSSSSAYYNGPPPPRLPRQ